MTNFEGVELFLQEGDIITFKKGMLSLSAITKESFLVKKAIYLGNGNFESLIKEKIEVQRQNNCGRELE